MPQLFEWLAALAILAPLPFLVRWGKRNARGSAGGVALLIGLAFGNLFDPASKAATESILKRREDGVQEDQAGDPPAR